MNQPIQYFKPADPHLFAGDCIPFSHNGIFYLYYLQDEGHHQGLGGLGGHQWALATSTDLHNWQHHPLALPITQDWEGSMCTGSVLHHAGQFYAFYATRKRDFTQRLSLAVSPDGLHYEKLNPNPFFSPPAGYGVYDFRDPFAFHGPDGCIHLIVSTRLENHAIPERGGCLAHLVAEHPLGPWELREPFLIPGTPDVPECPDLFAWNGWYYLLFSSRLQAHYRIARTPFGPWQRPPVDVFEAPAARVMKTAAWGQRRVGAAWLGEREGGRDNGDWQWGGQILLRELLQQPDGSLAVRPLPEAEIPGGPPLKVDFAPVTPAASCQEGRCRLDRSGGLEVLRLTDLPRNYRLRLRIQTGTGNGPFGLHLRAEGFESGYPLEILPAEGTAGLAGEELRGLRLERDVLDIQVTLFGSVIEACLDGRCCLAGRCPEQNGSALWFYALDREIILLDCAIEALDSPSFG